MNHKEIYFQIVFNTPLKNSFSYLPPENLTDEETDSLSCGVRVSAYLGKRKMTGFVVSSTEERPEGDFEIKRIEKIIDPVPLFDEEYYETVKWISSMYLCSEGEALFKMVPAGKQERKPNLFEDIDDDYTEVILNDEQVSAAERINNSSSSLFYLFGVTGSGKQKYI